MPAPTVLPDASKRLSQKAGVCGGKTHEARIGALFTALRSSQWFTRKNGADHALVSLWWGTTGSIGKRFAETIQSTVTIVAYDEYFAAEWTKVGGCMRCEGSGLGRGCARCEQSVG